MESRMFSRQVLQFVAVMLSFTLFADAESAKAARKFATGGEVTSFRYADKAGVGHTAFIHTFTGTVEASEFRNRTGRALPVRLLVVGGGGAGGDGSKHTYTELRYGGGGGGGGGVTETSAMLSAGDVWTVRVGAGGTVPQSHSHLDARGEAGASSVSNGTVEVALVPGGGAGGTKNVAPTGGAAGGGSGLGGQAGASGNYASSIGGVAYGPYSGDVATAGTPPDNYGRGGGGGGAGAAASGKDGGEGLLSDITGVGVVYGSGGGGGGQSRVINSTGKYGYTNGGKGGTNAGNGGTCAWSIEGGGATTNVVLTAATPPVANTGSGGSGGTSFVGGANWNSLDASFAYATAGADGVVIIRYEAELERPRGFVIVIE